MAKSETQVTPQAPTSTTAPTPSLIDRYRTTYRPVRHSTPDRPQEWYAKGGRRAGRSGGGGVPHTYAEQRVGTTTVEIGDTRSYLTVAIYRAVDLREPRSSSDQSGIADIRAIARPETLSITARIPAGGGSGPYDPAIVTAPDDAEASAAMTVVMADIARQWAAWHRGQGQPIPAVAARAVSSRPGVPVSDEDRASLGI